MSILLGTPHSLVSGISFFCIRLGKLDIVEAKLYTPPGIPATPSIAARPPKPAYLSAWSSIDGSAVIVSSVFLVGVTSAKKSTADIPFFLSFGATSDR